MRLFSNRHRIGAPMTKSAIKLAPVICLRILSSASLGSKLKAHAFARATMVLRYSVGDVTQSQMDMRRPIVLNATKYITQHAQAFSIHVRLPFYLNDIRLLQKHAGQQSFHRAFMFRSTYREQKAVRNDVTHLVFRQHFLTHETFTNGQSLNTSLGTKELINMSLFTPPPIVEGMDSNDEIQRRIPSQGALSTPRPKISISFEAAERFILASRRKSTGAKRNSASFEACLLTRTKLLRSMGILQRRVSNACGDKIPADRQITYVKQGKAIANFVTTKAAKTSELMVEWATRGKMILPCFSLYKADTAGNAEHPKTGHGPRDNVLLSLGTQQRDNNKVGRDNVIAGRRIKHAEQSRYVGDFVANKTAKGPILPAASTLLNKRAFGQSYVNRAWTDKKAWSITHLNKGDDLAAEGYRPPHDLQFGSLGLFGVSQHRPNEQRVSSVIPVRKHRAKDTSSNEALYPSKLGLLFWADKSDDKSAESQSDQLQNWMATLGLPSVNSHLTGLPSIRLQIKNRLLSHSLKSVAVIPTGERVALGRMLSKPQGFLSLKESLSDKHSKPCSPVHQKYKPVVILQVMASIQSAFTRFGWHLNRYRIASRLVIKSHKNQENIYENQRANTRVNTSREGAELGALNVSNASGAIATSVLCRSNQQQHTRLVYREHLGPQMSSTDGSRELSGKAARFAANHRTYVSDAIDQVNATAQPLSLKTIKQNFSTWLGEVATTDRLYQEIAHKLQQEADRQQYRYGVGQC